MGFYGDYGDGRLDEANDLISMLNGFYGDYGDGRQSQLNRRDHAAGKTTMTTTIFREIVTTFTEYGILLTYVVLFVVALIVGTGICILVDVIKDHLHAIRLDKSRKNQAVRSGRNRSKVASNRQKV